MFYGNYKLQFDALMIAINEIEVSTALRGADENETNEKVRFV